MRKLVHLSDLHFGRVDYDVVEPLISTVNEMKPDVVAVSGDLTQRARSHQFAEARKFLDALPVPQIIVPGNHDVPLYNFVARFTQPLTKYRRHITNDLEPFYADDEVAILGINTARALTTKYGRINERQIEAIRTRMCSYKEEMTKIIVTHHPFDLPEGHDPNELVGRAELAMQALASCGADVLLAGHLHVSHTGQTATRYKIEGHSALVISAGTATSTRARGETNSFNVVRINHPYIRVERFSWQAEAARFAPSLAESFEHTKGGWKRLSDEVAAGLTFAEESSGLQPHIPSENQKSE
ncbi:MAG TPA: metallophosphoesterase family protein [Pyrinomonadaceae bacterium]|jgi:3',5'-cyclic AMP phosphodiesterase CpdA